MKLNISVLQCIGHTNVQSESETDNTFVITLLVVLLVLLMVLCFVIGFFAFKKNKSNSQDIERENQNMNATKAIPVSNPGMSSSETESVKSDENKKQIMS